MGTAIDIRFPYMVRLTDRRVPRRAAAFARVVCARTRCKVAYDIRVDELYFYHRVMDSGVLSIEARRPDGTVSIQVQSVAEVVRTIMTARRSWEEKQRELNRARWCDERDKQESDERELETNRPYVRDYAAFLDRDRRGTRPTQVYLGP